MRASGFFISTQKEAPAEAEVLSHKLMLRAGLIRRLAAGITPGCRSGAHRAQGRAIVREEMNRAGALELSMPVVQPANWQESGRWQTYGPELLRFGSSPARFRISADSEEVITEHARRVEELPAAAPTCADPDRSRRAPPALHHARPRVHDEGRLLVPADHAGLEREYRTCTTPTRIFTRLETGFRSVAADPGPIGGTGSHEFHVLADSGEDAIAFCAASDYAANVELAEALAPAAPRAAPLETMNKVPTPGKTRCEDVAELLGLPLARTLKAIAVVHDQAFHLLLLRGDHSLNETRLGGPDPFASPPMRRSMPPGCRPGYIGPVGARDGVRVVADRTVALMSDFVCGANEEGFHITGVNWGRDLPSRRRWPTFATAAGDPAPDGKGTLGSAAASRSATSSSCARNILLR